MNKHLIRLSTIATGLALVLAANASGSREVVRAGNLYLVDNGGIFPSTLPKHGSAPVTALIKGEIGTVDGAHPPALRTVRLDVDKTIDVNAVGLPSCSESRIEASTTTLAKRACRGAVIGSGDAEVAVAFPEQAPFTAKGPVVAFNGGVHGGTTLVLLHAYVAVPAPTAVVARAQLTRIHRGRFGMRIVAEIPEIAGGAGSVTKFDLRVGRKFTYKGERESFLTASCPTGSYMTEGEALFSDGTKLGVTHAFPCTSRE